MMTRALVCILLAAVMADAIAMRGRMLAGPFGDTKTVKNVEPFSDVASGPIRRIVVHYNGDVTGIRATYGDKQGPLHGSTGANKAVIDLEEKEFITSVSGLANERAVISIQFVTNKPRTFGPFGGVSGNHFSDSRAGLVLTALEGRETKKGGILNALGFDWGSVPEGKEKRVKAPKNEFLDGEYHGSYDGDEFSDQRFERKPMTALTVRSATSGLLGLRARYGARKGPVHGSQSGGRAEYITFADGEHIVQIEGWDTVSKAGNKRIAAIQFATNKGRHFGPFGKVGKAGSSWKEEHKGFGVASLGGRVRSRAKKDGVLVAGLQLRWVKLPVKVAPSLPPPAKPLTWLPPKKKPAKKDLVVADRKI